MKLFEIHITVDCNDIAQFKTDCKEIGVKPIVINTYKGPNQVMTSSKHRDYDWNSTMQSIINKLNGKGYNVIRKKVEIKPGLEKNNEFKYYESHLRLKLPKNFVYKKLVNKCTEFNFHMSKNLFKTDEEFNYQMITYRNYYCDINTFTVHVGKMLSYVHKKISNTCCDKIEIEECVLDSNLNLDKIWLDNE